MLSASVIICAHADDRWDDTLAAVASVHAQSHPAKELIVVIDYNRPLYERLKAALPEAMVIENDHQQGLSGGRNTGIAAATGQVVAFLDDDAIAAAVTARQHTLGQTEAMGEIVVPRGPWSAAPSS